MRFVVPLGRALGLAVAGAVVGLASVAVHGLTTGLLLALAATAAAAVALPGGWTWRVPFSLGWTAVVAAGTQPRGSGSYLVASNARGYVLLVAGFALLMFSFVTAARRPSEPAPESAPEPPVS